MYAIEAISKTFVLNEKKESSKVVKKKKKKTNPDKDFFSACFQEGCDEIAREMGYKSKKTRS